MSGTNKRLEELRRLLQSLPNRREPPRTAFSILSQERSEAAWQAYIGYFLDPSQPHGLESRFLWEFVKNLSQNGVLDFELSEFELQSDKSLELELERDTSNGNRPDLVLYSEKAWFICIEIKVRSAENHSEGRWQTEHYATDSKIAPPSTEAYENGSYLYLAPADANESQSERFIDINWEDVVPILRNFIAEQNNDIPHRTLSQLSEFADLIETELNMNDIDQTTRHHKDLYFEYREEITTVEKAVKPFVEDSLQYDWEKMLKSEFEPETAKDYGWEYSKVGTGYGQVRLPLWQLSKEDEPFLDIHFEHLPEPRWFKQGILKFLLELEEPDRSTISSDAGERYYVFRDDILDQLEEQVEEMNQSGEWASYTVNPKGSKKKLLLAEYRYTPGDERGYYSALSQAVDDCLPAAKVVTSLLEKNDYTEYPR